MSEHIYDWDNLKVIVSFAGKEGGEQMQISFPRDDRHTALRMQISQDLKPFRI